MSTFGLYGNCYLGALYLKSLQLICRSGTRKWNLLMIFRCVSVTWLNTLRPRHNGRHFADDIFKCIFLNENVWTPIKISLKFVPKDPINYIPALVQIMAWHRPGDNRKQWWLVYWRIYASRGLSELKIGHRHSNSSNDRQVTSPFRQDQIITSIWLVD